jgi:hypothetical protein
MLAVAAVAALKSFGFFFVGRGLDLGNKLTLTSEAGELAINRTASAHQVRYGIRQAHRPPLNTLAVQNLVALVDGKQNGPDDNCCLCRH